ncbi:Sec-independent protein translocase subunit TatA [Nesterenkonia sp. LB17]|uniref:Sec-independent protein translocase subunit TatA n=1 Tax=unclassified Nesterenkonia TaxID=2629769 RepID=UPI001F4CE4EF|nr:MULTISPECIES: Sec-independent protein translocase subunit TatA [unclassified Nesterenkonia]MCH8559345.1 Sec-independent protein translocase subunit TatA [Nesterenkonia sp. DZ6]MCH8563233.1 Sec-independent protein translocase subunit TatA [Nesterenkonia sp. YGD6]MCH8564955.1 Sec-independent protein translocase subunit TatA [Nesterenkonia sp. LB17]MCH8571845.1 Sec-independent protein translocase subunit TatA [Nesterenkonia sp. AY15]
MGIQGWQFAIIALLIILLFGAPKLPKLAKSVGQSMRIFKSEVRTMSDESKRNSSDSDSESPDVSAAPSRDPREDERAPVEGRVLNPNDPTAEQARRNEREQRGDHR